MNVTDEERQKKSNAVLELVEKFIVDHKISCSETVYQCDDVIESAYEFIDSICEISGFYKYPGEEDED
jgi:hypothetical protein